LIPGWQHTAGGFGGCNRHVDQLFAQKDPEK